MEVFAHVEEQLRDHEIRAFTDFGDGVAPVAGEARRFRMGCRIPGDADAHVGIMRLGETDEIGGMAEFGGFPVDVLPLGDVAAQGQHIIHAVVAQALEILGNVVLRRADAGQVGHRFELEFFLQMGNDFQRGVLAGAARPVRNGREQRFQRSQPFGHLEEVRPLVRVFRREEFK